MDEKTKKILEDAYIADGAYCGCKQGEFAQPVKATHSTNVKLQGLKIMTCADSKVMKNVLDFGMCQLFGQCRLIEIAGQNIKWENFKSDVKIKGSKALNGASYFRCPFAAEEKINFYDHQQNKLDEDGKIRAKTTGEKLEEAGDYLGKSIKQVFLGEFTADEDRTFLGSMAEIALGFTGFDVIMDIRDMAACAMKGDWLGFGLSAIGVIPIIGGGIKAFNTARKGGNAVAEIAENAGKWAKSLKPAEAAKDMVKNAGQAAETIADVSTAAFKGGVKGVIKSAKYIKAFSEAPSLKRLADDILAAGKKIVVAGKDAVPKIKAKICEVKTSLGFNGCFSEETLIRTPNGYVKIENIKKGELIYSYNLLTGEIELKPVLEVLKTYNQGNTLKLKFKENVEIETTFNHEFMTSDGEWITAEELELETKVCTITGERISLEAKEIVRNVNPKIMYDLEIKGNHNYFVSERDLLVHNESCFGGLDPELLEKAKRIRKERDALENAEDIIKHKEFVHEFDTVYTNKKFLDNVQKDGKRVYREGKKTVTFVDETAVKINGKDVSIKDARILERNGEKIVYERFVKTYNVDINRGIKGATPEYVEFKVASYRPVYDDSQVIRGSEIHFNDLTSNYGTHFEQGNKILINELYIKNKNVRETLGSNYKVTKSRVFVPKENVDLTKFSKKNYTAYTWHHDLDGNKMYLVKTSVHNEGRHMGANSVINSLDKTGIDDNVQWEWRDKDKISNNITNFSEFDERLKDKRPRRKK